MLFPPLLKLKYDAQATLLAFSQVLKFLMNVGSSPPPCPSLRLMTPNSPIPTCLLWDDANEVSFPSRR